MFLHHIVTLTLLIYSLVTNFSRLGSLVIVLHDTVDIWLELAKLGQYSKMNTLSDFCFNMFGGVWFVTRIVMFPLIILRTTSFNALNYFDPFPAYYVLNSLLYLLQVMHIIWFQMIVKAAYRVFFQSAQAKDDRSVSSDSSQHEHAD